MSVGNYGAVKNQLEQQIAVDLGTLSGTTNGARSNQGVAILPSLIHQVLARPDFANTLNAKIFYQVFGGGNSAVSISANPANLVGFVWDNSQASTDAALEFYNIASPTPGTTSPLVAVSCRRNSQGVVLLPQPMSLDITTGTGTGLSYIFTTAFNGATGSAASVCTVLAIYTA